MIDSTAATRLLDRLPDLYPGPGGVAGIVHEGRVIAERAWGHRDTASAAPMTATTRLPICSISKQFTCAAFLAHLDPEAMDDRVAGYLPNLAAPRPTIRQLMANQSGLRDYWALTVLHGAQPEGEFRRSDFAPLLARMKTGHFAPGTSYSYCNHNFRILAEILETETGRPLADLYAETLFGPAGMDTAELAPDTAHPLDGVTGYEGTPATGFFPAVNRMFWTGDAGIAASLRDMLAWEAFVDGSDLYRRMAEAPAFADGAPSAYGQGLAQARIGGQAVTGHGGALRGFRAHRLHTAEARLSVVVIFNHEASAQEAATRVMEAALGVATGASPAPAWGGQWLDPVSGLVIRVERAVEGMTLRFGGADTPLRPTAEGAEGGGVTLRRDGERLAMHRPAENLRILAEPLPRLDHADGAEIAGLYRSAELEAELRIEARDGAVHVRATGHFGTGPAERLHPAGPDVWIMPVRRSMDAPAPGDWTVRILREGGRVTGLRVGCWLARDIPYDRAG